MVSKGVSLPGFGTKSNQQLLPKRMGLRSPAQTTPVLLDRRDSEGVSESDGLSQGPPSPAQGDPVSACLSWGTGRLGSLPIQPAPKGPAFLLWALRWEKGLAIPKSCLSSSLAGTKKGAPVSLLDKGRQFTALSEQL